MSEALNMIHDTLDFISGKKKPIKKPGLVDIMAWEKEMARKPKNPDWYGWRPESGMSQVDFFNTEGVSRHCTEPCKKCGFNFLNEQGGPLQRTETPLCGTW